MHASVVYFWLYLYIQYILLQFQKKCPVIDILRKALGRKPANNNVTQYKDNLIHTNNTLHVRISFNVPTNRILPEVLRIFTNIIARSSIAMEWNGPLRNTRFLPGGVAAAKGVGDREFLICLCLTHLPLDKNGRHLADDNLRCNFVNDFFFVFLSKFRKSLSLRIPLTIARHWFKLWLGAE